MNWAILILFSSLLAAFVMVAMCRAGFLADLWADAVMDGFNAEHPELRERDAMPIISLVRIQESDRVRKQQRFLACENDRFAARRMSWFDELYLVYGGE